MGLLLPFEGPFQEALSCECPHDSGITRSVQILLNSGGISTEALIKLFFEAFSVFLISSAFGGLVSICSKTLSRRLEINSGGSDSSHGSDSAVLIFCEKCAWKNAFSFSASQPLFCFAFLKVEPSCLKFLKRSSTSRLVAYVNFVGFCLHLDVTKLRNTFLDFLCNCFVFS